MNQSGAKASFGKNGAHVKMKTVIRKEYLLDGEFCPTCADKMQERIRKSDGVISARIDFASRKLTLEIGDEKLSDGIKSKAAEIVKQYEPDVELREMSASAHEVKTERSDKSEPCGRGLYAGAALFAAGIVFNFPQPVEVAVFVTAYALVGGGVLWKAVRNIFHGRVFDENFLMGAATVGAFCIGEYQEGVAVMLFYQVGEMFQRIAVGRSRRSIASLMNIRPEFANLPVDGGTRRVSPEEVRVGERIIVKPGERVPLDGVVVDGRSALDTSAITGEALPRDVGPGSAIYSGSINKSGLLTVSVTKEFGESTVSKILDLVQNAGSRKSRVENFITKFARYYTPVVVYSALALAVLPPLLMQGAGFADWFGRALVFLVVSCPCALVISIPLSFFGGIGGASRNGIMVKGSNFLDALHNVDTVVFDKTGTLTEGRFGVSEVRAANGRTEDDLLFYAAYAESGSNHPIAVSVRKEYGKEIEAGRVSFYEEVAGKGVRAGIRGKTVLAGNGKLMDEAGVSYEAVESAGTVVHVAADGVYVGRIVITDTVKADSKRAVRDLRTVGVRKVVMLSGDSKIVADKIASELGIDAVHAELLPHQKVERLEALEREKASDGILVFVGDGINDAPVLARADVGMAMGGIGSDAAIEAADVVLMTDEPLKIVTAIRIAKRTRSIVWQNVVFALGVKVAVLTLGAAGYATLWAAVFADVGVAVIAILNATRAMRISR